MNISRYERNMQIPFAIFHRTPKNTKETLIDATIEGYNIIFNGFKNQVLDEKDVHSLEETIIEVQKSIDTASIGEEAEYERSFYEGIKLLINAYDNVASLKREEIFVYKLQNKSIPKNVMNSFTDMYFKLSDFLEGKDIPEEICRYCDEVMTKIAIIGGLV
jgi:hypothetical protein